ncbi:MAG TPA: ferrochelatase [Nitrospinota bacterium]|nr:ferrochelatase [Nitrospinota bacterium]
MEGGGVTEARYDSVLLVGFGGPTRGCCRRYEDCPGEAFCFVKNVVGDRASGDERIREVAAHYEHFGGVSPFIFFSQKQAGALEMELERSGIIAPVYVGYRFWTPFVKEALAEMHRRGLRRTLGIALAPHRAKVSFEAYRGEAESARRELGGEAPEVTFAGTPWFDHPGYIGATVDRVNELAGAMGEERFSAARLIFSAHSIPVSMARTSPYREQFEETARLAAGALGRESHLTGFQSSPNVLPGSWLEPDVLDVVREAADGGAKDVIVIPVGFICDHIEVLFDLDVEAREAAEERGMDYFRAGTVGSHPKFISMLRDIVAAHRAGESG